MNCPYDFYTMFCAIIPPYSATLHSCYFPGDGMIHEAFIAAGSNVGDRWNHLAQARALLSEMPGVKQLVSSKIYETGPVGGPPQGAYLNTVWQVRTELDPETLLRRLFAIEHELGRIRAEKNGPRTLDLDMLDFDGQVLNLAGLTLPHPRMHERWFVLKPLADLNPLWRHPGLKKTSAELLVELEKQSPGLAGTVVELEKHS